MACQMIVRQSIGIKCDVADLRCGMQQLAFAGQRRKVLPKQQAEVTACSYSPLVVSTPPKTEVRTTS